LKTAGRDALHVENARLLAELVELKRDYVTVQRMNADLLGEQCVMLAEELSALEREGE